MRPAVELDVPIRLDRRSAVPLQRQLVLELRDAVLAGRLPAGRRLPSSRTLADRLGVARSTVLGAFEQLLGEGALEARHGAGTFVAGAVRTVPDRPAVPDPPSPRAMAAALDLRPGRPDTGRLTDPAWRRAWRDAAAVIPDDEPEPEGVPALRAAVARHAASARGVPADAERVVVCGGTREGLAVVVRALGLRRVAVEDPGYAAARRTLVAMGAEPVPVPVDDRGLDVDALPDDVDAVLVTPNHQYPLGGTMPLTRRTALVAWARRTGAVLLEDDYDGEFRYDVLPLPALAALDRGAVVHLGTFAKSVSPWIRCGYLLVPPALIRRVTGTRADLGQPVDGVTQTALAAFVGSGGLARHVARSRRDHAHRRARLLELLDDRPSLRPRGSSAGLHVVVELPEGVDTTAVLGRLAAQGVLLADLDDYRVTTRGAPAVVLGYGTAGLHELEAVVDALDAAVEAETGRAPRPRPIRG